MNDLPQYEEDDFFTEFDDILGCGFLESDEEGRAVHSSTSSITGESEDSFGDGFDEFMESIMSEDPGLFGNGSTNKSTTFSAFDDQDIGKDLEQEAQKAMMLPEMPSQRKQSVVEFLENSDGFSGHHYDVPSPPESSSLFGSSGVIHRIDSLDVFKGTDFVREVSLKLFSVAIGGELNLDEKRFCSTASRMFQLLVSPRYHNNEESDIVVFQREEGLLFGKEDMKSGSNRRGPKLDIVKKVGGRKPRYIKPLLARKNMKIGWFVCELFKKFLETKVHQENQKNLPSVASTSSNSPEKKKKKKKKKKRKKMKFTDFKLLMTYFCDAFEELLLENPSLHENLKKNVQDELINSLVVFRSKHFKSPQMNGCLLNYLFCHEYQKVGLFFHEFRKWLMKFDRISAENSFEIDHFRSFVRNEYENEDVIELMNDVFVDEPGSCILDLVKVAHGFFVVKVKEYKRINKEMAEILDEKLRMMKKKRKRGIDFDGNMMERKRRRFV